MAGGGNQRKRYRKYRSREGMLQSDMTDMYSERIMRLATSLAKNGAGPSYRSVRTAR